MSDFLIVGIGASAGGIQALKAFFEQVPEDSDMAYVVILHLSPDHDSQLAQVLQTTTHLPVTRVDEKVKVVQNHIYVVPPNQHLTMEDGFIIISPNILLEERRAPVDIFFRSLAESHGRNAVCVVLSGTGANGSMGLKRVKERGGATFVQNPMEAEFNEMPRNAIATGLVDEVLNVAAIPGKILLYRENQDKVQIPVKPEQRDEDQQQALRDVLIQLKVRTGHDFTNYKRPTLLRRIERRIQIRDLPDLTAYAACLHEHPDETTSLLKDLLISVTNFFRDKKAFEELEAHILPRLFQEKSAGDQVRIWIAGCATGEEAYSVAILCAEIGSRLADAPKVQIFATDIDESAIAKAREGFYTINDAADVSQERLRLFFTKEGDGYRINRELRETILFAHHNFIKDPPFSHLDLITCRNVLIYLNNSAQERVMETFHFALNAGGYLFLGTSESTDGASDLFSVISREHHIYQSRQVKARPLIVPESTPSLRAEPQNQRLEGSRRNPRLPEQLSSSEAHVQMLELYAPPSVVINEAFDIIHISERAGRYLQISKGEPTNNLLKLIRPELRLELRSSLYQAVNHRMPVTAAGLNVASEKGPETIDLHVRPALEGEAGQGLILVLFENVPDGDKKKGTFQLSDEPVARHLEQELIRLRDKLHSSNEQHELAAEELKASNEELQAMNEELRSAAEELETSKEELQSINEELRTVNQELKVKIDEISYANNNLQNLINSTDIGTIFLDRSFRVMLFTPAARHLFNLIAADLGRPISDITNQLRDNTLIRDAELVLESLQTIEREIRALDDGVFLMRLSPYRTADNRIQGVVASFVNISDRKKAERERAFLASIVESSQDSVITINFDGNITSWNKSAERLYGYPAVDAIGKPLTMLTLPGELREILTNIESIRNSKQLKTFDSVRVHQDGHNINLEVVLSPVKDATGQIIGVSTIARDVTARRLAEAALHQSEERYRTALQAADMSAWDWNILEDRVTWNDLHYIKPGLQPDRQAQNRAGFVKFVHPGDAPRVEAELAAVVSGETDLFHSEFRIVRYDTGAIKWMVGYRRAIEHREGKALRIVGVMYDITGRKALEQQKEDFIGIASHELKTPVTSIKAYSELLLSLLTRTGNEKGIGMAQKLDSQIDRLISLIHTLFDTKQIDQGQLELKPALFDMNRLLEERVEEIQRIAPGHRIMLRADKLPHVNGDRERLGQVMANLLTNAVKYAPGGGEVIVTAKTAAHHLEISVQDFGIGMEEATHQRIFERFYWDTSARVNTLSGLGLGLFIASEIVRLHGGTIGVESKPGEGSRFHFTLPLDRDKG